jgi:hypothetical protein
MEAFSEKKLATGETTFLESLLYPGNVPATVTTQVAFSSDGMFRYLDLKAQAGALAHSLRNVEFQLQENSLQLAQQYMLISGKEVLGTEYLADEGIYTSKEEVSVPQLDFLKNTNDAKRSVAALGMEDVKLEVASQLGVSEEDADVNGSNGNESTEEDGEEGMEEEKNENNEGTEEGNPESSDGSGERDTGLGDGSSLEQNGESAENDGEPASEEINKEEGNQGDQGETGDDGAEEGKTEINIEININSEGSEGEKEGENNDDDSSETEELSADNERDMDKD